MYCRRVWSGRGSRQHKFSLLVFKWPPKIKIGWKLFFSDISENQRKFSKKIPKITLKCSNWPKLINFDQKFFSKNVWKSEKSKKCMKFKERGKNHTKLTKNTPKCWYCPKTKILTNTLQIFSKLSENHTKIKKWKINQNDP